MAGGGKKHGRFFLLNGLLKTPDVLADVGRSRCSLDDPRPSRRLRPNPDDSARIEELERQLQCEREEREQERERALEEMERTRKEMEQEREQARVERVREHELFQEKTSYFTCALEVTGSILFTQLSALFAAESINCECLELVIILT